MNDETAPVSFVGLAEAVSAVVRRSNAPRKPFLEQDDQVNIDAVIACVTLLESYSDADIVAIMASPEFDAHCPLTGQMDDPNEIDFVEPRESVAQAVYEYLISR